MKPLEHRKSHLSYANIRLEWPESSQPSFLFSLDTKFAPFFSWKRAFFYEKITHSPRKSCSDHSDVATSLMRDFIEKMKEAKKSRTAQGFATQNSCCKYSFSSRVSFCRGTRKQSLNVTLTRPSGRI